MRQEAVVRFGLLDVGMRPTQELTAPINRSPNPAWQARKEGPQQPF